MLVVFAIPLTGAGKSVVFGGRERKGKIVIEDSPSKMPKSGLGEKRSDKGDEDRKGEEQREDPRGLKDYKGKGLDREVSESVAERSRPSKQRNKGIHKSFDVEAKALVILSDLMTGLWKKLNEFKENPQRIYEHPRWSEYRYHVLKEAVPVEICQ
ncbi:hypothetical protein ACLOJK_005763 [Asimina triloba]